MSEFKGFTFEKPIKHDSESQDPHLTNLSLKFNRISTDDNGSRLDSFKNFRSPIASRSRSEAQEKRRLEALELQKQQRQTSINKARQIALNTAEEDESTSDEEEEEEEEEQVEVQETVVAHAKRLRDSDDEMEEVSKYVKTMPKRKSKNKHKKKKNLHANQIMYSETMESVPRDLLTDWVLMICPKGKRCMVTSGSGETIARSRAGNILARFQSRLPNGSRTNRTSDFCILDCVYDAVHWTFYVLDIMCWRGYPIFDCDTNFRHFWLQTKLEPNELDRSDGHNQFYKFIPLKPVLTTNTQQVVEDPEQYVKSQGFSYDIDGLLFYHRQAHYRGGSTPLVCWVPRDEIQNMLK
ncbi:tRNA methyltransferase, has a role in tRNA modification [Mucor velutinosus]|uniref:Snurportin-1 n=1 Tax=Mucor velutinosus TaxID=708070 RepID=A0AAN7HZ30_9FUNG|nr:tRNA methyltransferase, has a role in tRNA modification [Mucor velutinosus]